MATGSETADCNQYWQKTRLLYTDGEVLDVVLDLPVVQKLKHGDEALMEDIRRRYRESSDEQPMEAQSTQNMLVEKLPKAWTKAETQLLFHTRKEMEDAFRASKTHKTLWAKIATELKDAGYKVTSVQCENKFKSLKREWRATVDHNNTSGNNAKTCPFSEEFNELYGMDAASRPSFTLASLPSTSGTETSDNSSDNTKGNLQTPKGKAKTPKAQTPKSALEWLQSYEERKLVDLPQDILREIITYLDMNDKVALASVNKTLRSYILGEVQNYTLSSSAIQSSCCLNAMYCLKKLTIVGVGDENSCQSLKFLNDIVSTGCLSKLHFLEFCGTQIDLPMLLSVISQLPCFDTLSTHRDCTVLSYRFIQQLLEQKKGIKFISGHIDVVDPASVELFGQLINRLCGRVTFGHAIIESLPRCMLKFCRDCYSWPFPTGKY